MLPEFLTFQNIFIFIVFIIVVFALYRLFKIIIRASIIAIAAFSFPWVVQYLGLPIPIEASVETGINFALVGVGLYFIYEFFHFIVYFLKIITWPIRVLFRRR